MSSLKDDTMKTADRVTREAKNQAARVKREASIQASRVKREATTRVQAAQEVGLQSPVRALSEAGFRSEWAYLGGFASIGLSLASWLLSRAKKDDRAQSDRWGIFIGHWAPTFFVLGLALKHEENDRAMGR
jgi:hypothetical protein